MQHESTAIKDILSVLTVMNLLFTSVFFGKITTKFMSLKLVCFLLPRPEGKVNRHNALTTMGQSLEID